MRGIELQANHEEKHNHAQFAHIDDGVRVIDQLQPEGPDHHPRQQVTQHRAETDALEQWHGHHGSAEQRDDTQQQSCVAFSGHGFDPQPLSGPVMEKVPDELSLGVSVRLGCAISTAWEAAASGGATEETPARR